MGKSFRDSSYNKEKYRDQINRRSGKKNIRNQKPNKGEPSERYFPFDDSQDYHESFAR